MVASRRGRGRIKSLYDDKFQQIHPFVRSPHHIAHEVKFSTFFHNISPGEIIRSFQSNICIIPS